MTATELQQRRAEIRQRRKEALQSDDPDAGDILDETQRQLAEIDKLLGPNAWQQNAKKLAEHAVQHLLNRDDGMGAYGSQGPYTHKLTQDISEARTEEIQRRLVSHFNGRTIGGIHPNSAPSSDGKWFARFGCIDIDLKQDHPCKEFRRERNLRYALMIQQRLAEKGIPSVIEDSNGRGAIHIWIWFSEPIEVPRLFAFLQSLIDDAEEHGFETQFQRVDENEEPLFLPDGDPDYGCDLPETFPKQAETSGKGFGNFIRLPGKHHTYDHWSRIWGDGEWLSIGESVEAWLSLPATDIALIPELPPEVPEAKEVATPIPVRANTLTSVDVSGCETLVDLAERTIGEERWCDLLESAGWKMFSENGAESKWTRPGKNDGVSATLNFNGNNLFHVFTKSVSGIADNQSYSKWRFYLYANGFGNEQVRAAKTYLPAHVVEEHDRKSREEWKARQEKSAQDPNRKQLPSLAEVNSASEVWICNNAVDEFLLADLGTTALRAPDHGKESFTDWTGLAGKSIHIIDGGTSSQAATLFSLVSHYAAGATVQIHPLQAPDARGLTVLKTWLEKNPGDGDTLDRLRAIPFVRSEYGTTSVEEIEIAQGFRAKPAALIFHDAWEPAFRPRPMRECIIEGLLRRGEVGNVIASTKTKKSWLVLLMCMCIALGRDWLGRRVAKGPVLLIDNELHDEVIENRLAAVRFAMDIRDDTPRDRFEYVACRGDWISIENLIEEIPKRFPPGSLNLIVIDAKYRLFGNGLEENSNDDQTTFHNLIDKFAKEMNSPVVLVHHSTKGDQSTKSVTDIGSGGGSQSRAVDLHMTIRPHQQPGMAVMDAAVRSFAPVEPVTLRWNWPIWSVDKDVDPTLPTNTKDSQKRQEMQSRILKYLTEEWQSITKLAERCSTKRNRNPFADIIDQLQSEGQAEISETYIPPRSTKETTGIRRTPDKTVGSQRRKKQHDHNNHTSH